MPRNPAEREILWSLTEDDLLFLRRQFAYLILMTPTSPDRNQLTELNISLMSAAEAAGKPHLLHDGGVPTPPAPADEPQHSTPWPAPTAEMQADPKFEAVWQAIKTWDINVPEAYPGHCGATGNHVRAILDALDQLEPAAGPPIEPTREMLEAARDWSHGKYGKPIGDVAARGCWQAMFRAALRAPKEPNRD